MMDGPRSILIVDDERGVRDMLARALVGRGFTCQVAPDGVEALRCLEQAAFAVVLADIRMPHLDGIELLKRVKARWSLTEVIIITGVFDLERGIHAPFSFSGGQDQMCGNRIMGALSTSPSTSRHRSSSVETS